MVDYYAKKMLNNEKLLPVHSGDDIYLMGGDYIVSENYQVVYEFASQETERPTVENLLSTLYKLQN